MTTIFSNSQDQLGTKIGPQKNHHLDPPALKHEYKQNYNESSVPGTIRTLVPNAKPLDRPSLKHVHGAPSLDVMYAMCYLYACIVPFLLGCCLMPGPASSMNKN